MAKLGPSKLAVELRAEKLELQTTNPRLKALDAKSRRALIAVVAASALVVGAVVVLALLVLADHRPEDSDLRLAYPYGFAGKRGTKGELAPGANEVRFELLGKVASCEGHTHCLRYQYRGGDGFEGTMIVGQTRDKQWERVGREGLPFQPVTEEGRAR